MSKQTETTISFNTPLDIKARLQNMADENGVTISVLMRMSAIQLLNRGIRISPNVEPSDHLLKTLKEADEDAGNGMTTTVSDENELNSYLGNLKR